MGIEGRQVLTSRRVGAMVSHLAATNDVFADLLATVDETGHGVIVPAVETDSIVEVTKLVAQGGGIATYVVVGEREDGFALSVGTISRAAISACEGAHVPVTRQCTIGDMLKVLLPGTSITYRMCGDEISLGGVIEGDLDEDGELEFAS